MKVGDDFGLSSCECHMLPGGVACVMTMAEPG